MEEYRENTWAEEKAAREEEIRIRKTVRDEIQRNFKPKRSFFSVVALVLVGAILGSLTSLALIKTGSVDIPYLVQRDGDRASQDVKISLKEGSTVESAVAKKTIPSIVGITTIGKGVSNNPFFYGVPKYTESVGSGVIVSSDGYIVTNSHVVDNGKAESIKTLLSNGEEVNAKLVWNDSTLDLAVIKIDKTGLKPIEFGDMKAVNVGDKSIAIGNPLGLELQSTLTSGYISGMERSITVEGGNIMDGLIQTDAAINGGNSGGALLNAEGKLIGINTAKPASADGIGFAIPVSTIKPIVEKILKTGSYDALYLGVTGYNVALAKQLGKENLPVESGVVIHEVVAGSPAAKADLQPGDILVDIGGSKIDSMNSLKTALLKYKAGDKAGVTVYRGDSKMQVEVTFQAEGKTFRQ